jgi:hypothetical protein
MKSLESLLWLLGTPLAIASLMALELLGLENALRGLLIGGLMVLGSIFLCVVNNMTASARSAQGPEDR